MTHYTLYIISALNSAKKVREGYPLYEFIARQQWRIAERELERWQRKQKRNDSLQKTGQHED